MPGSQQVTKIQDFTGKYKFKNAENFRELIIKLFIFFKTYKKIQEQSKIQENVGTKYLYKKILEQNNIEKNKR